MTAMPPDSAMPWTPEDLPIDVEEVRAWGYVVLEEFVDKLVLLRRWPWPVVDPLGRLLWPDGAEHDSVAASVDVELLKAQLYRPSRIEREPRCGDTFATPRVADAGWHPPTTDLRDLLGEVVYDISADAREAAKIAYQSSLGAITPEAAADEDSQREVERLLRLRAEDQLQPLQVSPPPHLAQLIGLT